MIYLRKLDKLKQMKTFYSLIILLLTCFNGFCQKLHYLETFNSIQSVKSWKINNNGVMLHTNHFTFNGKTFYKNSKDSFLVFYDTSYKWDYSFELSKKFKAIPSQGIHFSCSLFSQDSLYDNGYATYKIYDKNKKTLFVFTFLMFPMYQNNVVIAGGGLFMKQTKDDTLWQKADSFEIIFHFNPNHPYDSFKRMIVIDDVFLENVFANVKNVEKNRVEIYPNPATKVINIKYLNTNQPEQIELYDNIGRPVTVYGSKDLLNIENLTPGIYILKIKFEDGKISINKIEVF